jgi:hypothetical protein
MTKAMKIDLRKRLKHLYGPSKKEVVEINVPEMKFLMIGGSGDPNTSQAYQEAVEALYAVSYALKFVVKENQGVDYGVMPLEGLWWMDEEAGSFQAIQENKEAWKWTLMIMQPEVYVTEELVEEAEDQARTKRNLPALPRMRFETFHEGPSAQILHVGPFAEEGSTIDKIHRYIEERGHQRSGKHHEIYLSDFNRTAPERLKTVVRQPIARVG